jgi:fused signal recognition particle receptor
MEIALVGLVVVALVLFFVLRKKPGSSTPADQDDAPFTTPSKQVQTPRKAVEPRAPDQRVGKPETGAQEITRPSDTQRAVQPQDAAPRDEYESSFPSADVGLVPDTTSSDENDFGLSVVPPQDDAASPPPPPARSARSQDQETLGKKPALASLRKGLARSRGDEGLFGKLKGLITGKKEIDPKIAEEIEEVLLASDVGVHTTESILDRIKQQLNRGELKSEAQVWAALRNEARRTLSVDGRSGGIVVREQPTVILLVGVNGAGKTTTIGKLAAQFSSSGKKVMLAAGDTFRAAAVDQLRAWGERVGCEVIGGKENADPSSVLFDAVTAAKDRGADILLADTAGRLHTKTNLMQEMTKIQKVIAKALPGAPHEILLVIDSTNGQNAMAQAREFKEALELTGLILTKLDGTARGGAVLGICDVLQLPIRYIGVGEGSEHLYEFDTDAFVEALLGTETDPVSV